jgi:hypothetical protein
MRMRLLVALAGGLLGLAACARAPAPESASRESASKETAPEEVWEAFYIDGQKIGHGWTRSESAIESGREVVKIDSGVELAMQRFGEDSTQRVLLESLETKEGKLLSFRSEVSSGEGQALVATGKTRGDRIVIEQGAERQVLPGKDLLGFMALEQSLEAKPMSSGETRELKHLFPLLNQVAKAKLTAAGEEEVELLGERRKLLRIDCVTTLPGGPIETTLWVDDEGKKWKYALPSMKQVTYRTTREQALQKDEGPAYDLGESPIVKLARPLERADETVEIVFRASVSDGAIAGAFVDDGFQDVKSIDERSCELTVRRPAVASEGDGPSEADRGASRMIESDDQIVRALAAAGAPGEETEPSKIAITLSRFVNEQMKPNTGFTQALASAAETAASLRGDCTEHAMLLAALCRVREVPARVAIGLVYYGERQGFAYHMWTEAWTGDKWLALDATRVSGVASAAYLKVAHSSLSGVDAYAAFLPVQRVLGRLELEIVSVKYK